MNRTEKMRSVFAVYSEKLSYFMNWYVTEVRPGLQKETCFHIFRFSEQDKNMVLMAGVPFII